MMSELVSIIVPIYNVEKYLRTCIESVIGQTYKNIEIILVNDGSTDDSAKICKEYIEKDTRIVYIEQENRGLSGARNAGISIATGEYLLFLDSDDFIDVDFIEVLYQNLIVNNADFSVGGVLYESETGQVLKTESTDCVLDGKQIISFLACSGNVLLTVAWGRLYKRYLFENIRYPERKLNEDEYVALELCRRAKRVSISSKVNTHYIQRQDSIMHHRFNIDRLQVMNVFVERLKFFEEEGAKQEYVYTLEYIRKSLSMDYVQIRNDKLGKKSQEYIEFMKWYECLWQLYEKHKDWIKSPSILIKMKLFKVHPFFNTIYLLRIVGKM